MKVSDDIVEGIHSVLISESQDIESLDARLKEALHLSPDNSRSLIYQVATKLNAALFPPITKMELILTERCNLSCAYCFEKNMHGKKEIDPMTAKAAVDLFFDYSGNESLLHITYFGGEPTLNFPEIERITEYARQKAFQTGKTVEFNMTSNGVLLTEKMVDYFAEHKIKVLLSIDGLETTHNQFRTDKSGKGTYKQVMRGLKILKRKQPWVGAKMTIMPKTVSSLYEDVLGLYENGINQFIIGYATGVKWSEDEMKTYAEQLRHIYHWYKQADRNDLRINEFDAGEKEMPHFGCQAGRSSIAVSANGEISPCSKILTLNSNEPLMKLGDTNYGLTHICNRTELVGCSKLCSACEAQGIARDFMGGCFAANFEDNRDLFQPSIQDHNFSKLKKQIMS